MLIQQSPTNPNQPPIIKPNRSRFQKTAQSATQQSNQHHFSIQEYHKLQELLQIRQASLREHVKHQYQLKLYIEQLEDKNKQIQKNLRQVVDRYKQEMTQIKRENQELRKNVKLLQQKNAQNQSKLNNLTYLNTQYRQQAKDKDKPQSSSSLSHKLRPRSQTTIKVIQSQDQIRLSNLKQSSSIKLPEGLVSNKQSPFLQSNSKSHKRNNSSHSRQKIKVTMKTSRVNQGSRDMIDSNGKANIRDILINRQDRGIKKIMQLKKWNQVKSNEEALIESRKLLVQKNASQNPNNPISQKINSLTTQEHNPTRQQLPQQDTPSKNRQPSCELIKLGHYPNSTQLTTQRGKPSK